MLAPERCLLIKSGVFNSRLASRASLFAPDDAPPVEWVVTPGLTQYSDALAEMESRAEAIARGDAPERVWLIEHPPLYTAGHQREGQRPCRRPVSGSSRRTRRPIHLSRARTAGRLRHARPQAPTARCASLCGLARTLADRDAEGVRRRRRDAREPGWRMGRATRQTGVAAGRNGRGQDRRHRRARAALGDAARRLAQRRSGSYAFFRHRPVRHRRSPLWRHQSRRPRPRHDHGASGRWRCARRSKRCSAQPDPASRTAPRVARPTAPKL